MKKYIALIALTMTPLMFQNCGGFQVSDYGKNDAASQAAVSFRVPYRPNAGGFRPSAVDGSATGVMERLKYKACMMDGLLSDDALNEFQALLLRSSCVALPRAVETWNKPPDFVAIKAGIDRIAAASGGRHFDYGMFIAESIDTTKIYKDDTGANFDFAAMCKPGSRNQWGPNTCVPHVGNPEYQRYLKYIVGKAAEVGINNILFGQTGHQDPNMTLASFLGELRAIARSRGKVVLFGQQPNGNQPTGYLKLFDYVTGPVYVDDDVSAPCLPRIKTYCQAVLHHPSVAGNANNVIVELDWGSLIDDDTNKYAAKSQAQRKAYLNDRVAALFAAGIGFNFPFRQMLAGDASGAHCYGPSPYIYSAHNEYGCKDETFLDEMLNGKFAARPVSGTPAPVDSDEYFVRGLYESILRRPADAPGLRYWVGVLSGGQKTRPQVRADFNYICGLRQTECL